MLPRSIALQRRALELVDRAPRPRRRLRARRRAAAGAARHHADAGRRAAAPARPVRACDRHADRHAGAELLAGARPAADSRRRRCRSACPPTCWSAGPTSPSAERAMAAANAQIGVATRGVLPEHHARRRTTASRAARCRRCSTRPACIWSVGVSLRSRCSTAAALQANVDFARAGYDATVANYRRVVLTAMQEVEDGITGLAALERALPRRRSVAVASARARARAGHRALRGRRRDLPRRHHRAAGAAQQRAPGRAAARASAC